MFFIDELDDLRLYKKPFLLPLNEKDKKKNSAALLMCKDAESSINTMGHPLMNPKYYISYYLERAVMYYINQEGTVEMDQEIIEESLEDIVDGKEQSKIIYSGYSHEIVNLKRYMDIKLIKKLNQDYRANIKYPIKVNIVGRSGKKENTARQIWLLSEPNYNRSLKDYGMYVKYNIIELLIMCKNPKLPNMYKYALAIYDSGLYHLHKYNWIFGDQLKRLCKMIDMYVEIHGHPQMVKDVIKDPRCLSKDEDIVDRMVLPDLKNLFNISFSENADIKNNVSDDNLIPLNDSYSIGLPIHEDKSYNSALKKNLYADRFKTLNEIKDHYKNIKDRVGYIKYTYNTIEMYKSLNLFIDMAHYMYSYFKNSSLQKERGYKLFGELFERLVNDKRYIENGYTKKTIIIPIQDWIRNPDKKEWMINVDINPISYIFHTIKMNLPKMKQLYGDTIFIFISKRGYFKIDFSKLDLSKNNQIIQSFTRYIRLLSDDKANLPNEDNDERESSSKAITMDLVDKIEKSQGIEINNITDDSNDDKAKLVKTISRAAMTNVDIDGALDDLDQDDELKEIIANLSSDADNKTDISSARASRMIKLQNDLMDKQFKGKSIRDLTSVNYDEIQLQSKSLDIDSVNEEWNDLKFITQEEVYNMDSDIVQIFNQFADKSYPLAVRDIKVEDNSTSENATLLYTVSYEDANGKRFSVKVDIPKWVDNKYLVLSGNIKELPNQLFLMPISKTDTDTVQIVTNYNKIFIRRFGTTTGKSFIICDRLIKTIEKNKFKSLKIYRGDNLKICNKYELPIDYIDMASSYNKLVTPSTTIYFNQDELRKDHGDKIDMKNGIPIGIQGNSILYYNSVIGGKNDEKSMTFSQYLLLLLETDTNLNKDGFKEAYDASSRSIRYTYSRASVLNTNIPTVIMCAYAEGLTRTLKKGNIKYRIESSKKSLDPFGEDFIKFNDAYIIYELDYASSLLMNGLKACPTSEYSISEMDSKPMYLDFLDLFGGRINADRLDNFYNLLIDKPITYDALKYYNLPTDYVEVLLYANRLLADNKFNKHTSLIDNRRTRRHEQIPAVLYSCLSSAYGQYCINMKHGRYVPMSMKQSIVCDEILKNSTTSDMSIINALCEYESYASVTPKGPCGMNSDRSYTLDKRSFDKSMLNVMGMSTGFAGNVGINRQLTIDASINTARGYIKDNKADEVHELSATKSFCMTEALTPFGSTRDDPFRTAMTFIQTSKHGIRCKRSNPALITSGADEALPYMVSNIFAFKSKDKGVVKELNEERMIVEYDNGTYDYIDLSERVEKNSSSGFYQILKLDTDLKEGQRIKKGQIIAYDKLSFSDDFGATNNIAYNIGTMCKFAALMTDEGFEDSAIISSHLSDAMTSDIVLQIDKVFDKNTNIYNMVKKGQKIEEGDTLLIAQASYDEEDINTLLRNLTADDDSDITELGRIPIKSKVTGWVQDIKIYRTVDIEELSPTLQKIVNDYERGINKKKKEMEKYGVDNIDINLGSTGKLPPIGRLKNVDNGVKIEFYLKYEDKMKVGDKLIFYSANKGVVKDIFPEGKEPRSEYRPNEAIHALMSSESINGRMVGSIMINGAINKGLIELGRQCKDILGIKYPDNLF